MPLIRALRAKPRLKLTVVVTGQHRQMLDQVFQTFGERPDLDLALMRDRQTLPQLTADIIVGVTKVLEEQRPDLVLVQGDTTTALGAAMAAFYARLPIGHVEAGLRSDDLTRPWPEEFNRVAIDGFADYLFAPTEVSRGNLDRETKRGARIFVTGNTGIDALLHLSRRIDEDAELARQLTDRYAFLDATRPLILVTGHRRESFGEGLQRICDALARLARELSVEIIYPVHLNPHVRDTVMARLGGLPNLHLCEPVEYADMVFLMKKAKLIISDSGGIQEEAPALGRRVLVTRDVTERPEALDSGHLELVGSDPALIRRRTEELLASEALPPSFPYGDGTAAIQIADILDGALNP
jgi:UDP-N-acetylglucosamine 2-epimerase (non-hydrolysing)